MKHKLYAIHKLLIGLSINALNNQLLNIKTGFIPIMVNSKF